MNIRHSVWDDKAVKLLKNWWEVDGLTSYAIEDRFKTKGYPITRNAVIGKVFRMKLVAPEEKEALLKEANTQRAAVINRARAKVSPIKKTSNSRRKEVKVLNGKPDSRKAILLTEAKDGQCKYIIGYINGKVENAVYCGEDTIKTTSWCPYHRKICLNEFKR